MIYLPAPVDDLFFENGNVVVFMDRLEKPKVDSMWMIWINQEGNVKRVKSLSYLKK
jgi:hypothetical protein